MSLPIINKQTFKVVFPHSNQEVTYRPMLLSEEKIIITAKDVGEDSDKFLAIKQIVSNCIVSDTNIDKLTTFELEYMFIHIFKRSKGDEISVAFKCPKCNSKTPLEINLDEVKFKYTEGHTNDIPLDDKVGIIFKYPDFSLIQELGSGDENGNVKKIMSLVDSVYDENTTYDFTTVTEEEKTQFFDQLTFKQFEKIGQFISTMPQVLAKKQAVCSNDACKYEQTVEVKGLLDFLA